MVYFKEHSIKEINKKEQAAAGGGTSADDKAKIDKLEQQLADLDGAIERGLSV